MVTPSGSKDNRGFAVVGVMLAVLLFVGCCFVGGYRLVHGPVNAPRPEPTRVAVPAGPTPVEVETSAAAPTTAAVPAVSESPTPLAVPSPVPSLTSESPAQPAEGVYYRNCTEAWEAGAAPLHRGEPGYRSGLDRDNDGTACEERP